MQLPSIVKPIGKVSGESRVYIEDYAYTYLCERKNSQVHFPTRVALYGHAFQKEDKQFYLIYGASGVIEEMERGRTQEDVGKDFFKDYSLIGYINLYNGVKLPGEKEGCFVFYDKNEAMQSYLLSCYEKNFQMKKREEIKVTVPEESEFPWENKRFISCFFQKFLLSIMILVATASVAIINQYQQMQDFVMTAARAVRMLG